MVYEPLPTRQSPDLYALPRRFSAESRVSKKLDLGMPPLRRQGPETGILPELIGLFDRVSRIW